jgi:hypothetical protein
VRRIRRRRVIIPSRNRSSKCLGRTHMPSAIESHPRTTLFAFSGFG